MGELKTRRPYQERFLENFDRSQLRREVEAVKPRRFAGLKKKYASWALGASLAIGGMGIPMRMAQQQMTRQDRDPQSAIAQLPQTGGLDDALAKDLRAAESIAKQVATGVASGVQSAASSPLATVAEAPKQFWLVPARFILAAGRNVRGREPVGPPAADGQHSDLRPATHRQHRGSKRHLGPVNQADAAPRW